MAKLLQVIESEALRGGGFTDGGPTRVVKQYWTLEGQLIAEHDPQHPFPRGKLPARKPDLVTRDEKAEAATLSVEADEILTAFWVKHYIAENGSCSLCGNTGVLETVGTKMPVNIPVNRRIYCICPNGRGLRELRGDQPPPGDV